jgi:hypothetical protein
MERRSVLAASFVVAAFLLLPGADFGCNGSSCSIVASHYDQSCTTDTDCAGVAEGDTCSSTCAPACPNAAINKAALNQYNSELTAKTTDLQRSCSQYCVLTFGPCCVAGRCQMGNQCPTPGVLVTPADASAD